MEQTVTVGPGMPPACRIQFIKPSGTDPSIDSLFKRECSSLNLPGPTALGAWIDVRVYVKGNRATA